MKFLKKQRIRNAEKAEDCSEIEEMELRLKMMKEHLTIHLIEIDRICPSALVLPYPADRLNELCDSIRRFGLLQPLTVRRVCKEASSLGGIFTLISGNGRLEALKKLGIRKAPCFIVNLPASSALSASAASLLHNEKRDVFEQAEILSAVSEEQCISNEELARRLSIDPKELKKGIEYALSFSHCDEFIIEDFITQKGFSSDTDSFSVDGELKFVSFNSQRFDADAENPYTPAAYSWPSSMSDEHQEELKNEIQRLLHLLNMGTSIYNVETREGTDGKAYIMEVSPRGGGNRLAECLHYATGVDLVKNTVRAAVGLPVEGVEQKPYDGCWAEVILHSDRAGVFDSLWIADDIKENVFERDLWIEAGTEVGGFSAANEAIGTLILRFDTDERLQQVMKDINQYVKVVLA